MATMNIFRDPAFSMMSTLSLVQRIPFVPSFLGSIPGMWTPKPVRTETIPIEITEGTLSVIQTSERGEAAARTEKQGKREVVDIRTNQLAKNDRIWATEVANIRAYGETTELMQVKDEVALRLGGPTGLLAQLALTEEYHRLGAIDGQVLDADGAVLHDWYSIMGVVRPAALEFDFAAATADGEGVIRQTCRGLHRDMKRAAGGVVMPSFKVYALCGDNFFDKLVDNAETRSTYLNQQEAGELRKVNDAFDSFTFGNVTFVNYQGSEDGVVGVPTDEARAFPVAPGLFEHGMSPGLFNSTLNMPGQRVYPLIIPDKDRDMWVDVEIYSYPAFICKRPESLRRLKIKAPA